MNNINQNKINNSSFGNFKPNPAEVKEAEKMENLIKEAINNLLLRAEREVPEYGSFSKVSEKFKNIDESLITDKYVLEIVMPPKDVENYQKKRALKILATKPNCDSSVEMILAIGSKEDILAKLKDSGLVELIKEKSSDLSYNLEDVK